MSPPPKPASPVPVRVDITPETVDRAAANFAIGQQDLIKAYTTLSQKLSAHSSGMAGFDKAAHQFAALYDPAARAVYQAFHKAIEALGGTSLGLTQTVNNHLAADHHSRADHPGGGPPRFSPHPVSQNFAVAAAPPPVVGAMSWAPNTTVPLIRHAVPHLPGWVDGLLGTSNDWPQGNPEMFDQTGDAWTEAARETGQVASWLNWTVTTILDPADNAEHAAVAAYWATLYRPGDSTTILSGLQEMCTALANACHEYAQATRDATRIVTGEHIAEIILLLGAGAVTGLLRKLFGRILSRVGAYMLSRVAGIAERWALRRILADLIKATADTKVVKTVQAAFDKTVGKKLEAALEAERKRLIDELIRNGTKCSPESIVAIARDSSGKIIFLETGSPRAGLQHIIERHGREFAQKGIPESQVPEFVMHAVTEGTKIGYQGKGTGRPIYQFVFNGKMYKVAVTVGGNGFIVGANLK
ncbi:hypothetical protein [Actinomadura sp. NTSP31]|uniref:WXG100-like domain-containing protein n=1 Tax=Actinomadura sp. NTSP31 TaxID=1735447 RepID=UPI0035BECE77